MKVILGQLKKPWNETRLKDKIGLSLEKVTDTDLYFFGHSFHSIKNEPSEKTFQTPENQPLFFRLIAFFNFLKRINPDAIIIASPLLLVPALVYKFWKGAVLVFDCQENFAWNYAYQKGYSRWKSILYSSLSQFFLRSLMQFPNKIWLAEKIYGSQIEYLPEGKCEVFENKVSESWLAASQNERNENPGCTFLLSGFLTIESGLEMGLDFMQAFKEQVGNIEFQLVGKIAAKGGLEAWKAKYPWANFEKCSDWTESKVILRSLQEADAVLMPYIISKANEEKFPSKMFEAIFAGKPMLCQAGSHFLKKAEKAGLGISVDFEQLEKNDFPGLYEKVKNFRTEKKETSDCLFEGEKLRKDFFGLFPKKNFSE